MLTAAPCTFILSGFFESAVSRPSFAVSPGPRGGGIALSPPAPCGLILTVVFLRGLERINARTVTGTFAVMTGTISIILSR